MYANFILLHLVSCQGCNPSTQFQCLDDTGGCIPLQLRCDEVSDCIDGSDEFECRGNYVGWLVCAILLLVSHVYETLCMHYSTCIIGLVIAIVNLWSCGVNNIYNDVTK